MFYYGESCFIHMTTSCSVWNCLRSLLSDISVTLYVCSVSLDESWRGAGDCGALPPLSTLINSTLATVKDQNSVMAQLISTVSFFTSMTSRNVWNDNVLCSFQTEVCNIFMETPLRIWAATGYMTWQTKALGFLFTHDEFCCACTVIGDFKVLYKTTLWTVWTVTEKVTLWGIDLHLATICSTHTYCIYRSKFTWLELWACI